MSQEEKLTPPSLDRIDGELSEDQLDTIAGGLGQRTLFEVQKEQALKGMSEDSDARLSRFDD